MDKEVVRKLWNAKKRWQKGTKLIMARAIKFGTKCGTRLNKHKLQNSPWNASCVRHHGPAELITTK